MAEHDREVLALFELVCQLLDVEPDRRGARLVRCPNYCVDTDVRLGPKLCRERGEALGK
jgi:hypothetical protein